MTGLVEAHPAVAAIDAQIAEVQDRESRFRAWASEQGEIHRDAVSAYEAAKREAIESGKPVKMAPPPPSPVEDAPHHLASLQFEITQLREERQLVMAGLAAELTPVIRDRYAALMRQVHDNVAELRRLSADMRSLQADTMAIAVSQNMLAARDPNRGREQLQQLPDPTPAVLVDAAQSGRDLLATTATRRLGMASNLNQLPSGAYGPNPTVRTPEPHR